MTETIEAGVPVGYAQAINDAIRIVERKNQGYGRANDPWHNFRGGIALGVGPETMVMLRIHEKLNRLDNYYGTGETTVDAREEALDVVNLAAILVALIDEHPAADSNRVLPDEAPV